MVKFVALYKKPDDIEAFEKHYFEIHMPLVAKIPGLIKSETARLSGMPSTRSQTGQEIQYYLITEMYFESMDLLNEGMASPEGKAAGRDLMGFAKKYVVLMNGEIVKAG